MKTTRNELAGGGEGEGKGGEEWRGTEREGEGGKRRGGMERDREERGREGEEKREGGAQARFCLIGTSTHLGVCVCACKCVWCMHMWCVSLCVLGFGPPHATHTTNPPATAAVTGASRKRRWLWQNFAYPRASNFPSLYNWSLYSSHVMLVRITWAMAKIAR